MNTPALSYSNVEFRDTPRVTSKYGFMDSVKWKVNDDLFFHGWVINAVLHENQVVYSICFLDISGRDGKIMNYDQSRPLVEAIKQRQFSNGCIIPENILVPDPSNKFSL